MLKGLMLLICTINLQTVLFNIVFGFLLWSLLCSVLCAKIVSFVSLYVYIPLQLNELSVLGTEVNDLTNFCIHIILLVSDVNIFSKQIVNVFCSKTYISGLKLVYQNISISTLDQALLLYGFTAVEITYTISNQLNWNPCTWIVIVTEKRVEVTWVKTNFRQLIILALNVS